MVVQLSKRLSFCGNSSHSKVVHAAQFISLGDLGFVGWVVFFPPGTVIETNIKMFPQICCNNKCSCAVELGLLFKNVDCFLQVLSTGSKIKVTFAVV